MYLFSPFSTPLRFIEKEKKRAQKQAKEEEKKKTTQTAQSVEEALAGIKEEDFPTSMEEREKFCMEQLSTGEALFTRGKKTGRQLSGNWRTFEF